MKKRARQVRERPNKRRHSPLSSIFLQDSIRQYGAQAVRDALDEFNRLKDTVRHPLAWFRDVCSKIQSLQQEKAWEKNWEREKQSFLKKEKILLQTEVEKLLSNIGTKRPEQKGSLSEINDETLLELMKGRKSPREFFFLMDKTCYDLAELKKRLIGLKKSGLHASARILVG